MFPRYSSRPFSSLSPDFLNRGNGVDALASRPDGAEVLTGIYDGLHTADSVDDGLRVEAASSRALDFVTRASRSNRSLDDHFKEISGSKFEECKRTSEVSAKLASRRKSSESYLGDIYEDLKEKLEYEESDLVSVKDL